MAEPLLLTYNLDPGTSVALSALCRAQGIRVHAVNRDEYACPVGALAGIPVRNAQQEETAVVFSDSMLVMCHMLSPQLDAFLKGMREAHIPHIPLKAVLTPFNAAWSSSKLHDELAREREEIMRNK